MNTHPTSGTDKKSADRHLVSHVLDELSESEHADVGRALASSEALRRSEAQTRRIVQALRALPAPPPSRDIAASVVAQLRGEHEEDARCHGTWLRPLLKAAAVFALVLAGLWAIPRPGPTGSGPSSAGGRAGSDARSAQLQALDWLASAQHPSGGWGVSEWGDSPRAAGLTGLALLALLQSDAEDPHPEAIQQGTAFLLRMQNARGLFGDPGPDGLRHHAIATCALLAARRRHPSLELEKAVGAAVRHIAAYQVRAGAWSYGAEKAGLRAMADSAWPVLALAWAEGEASASAPLRRELAALARGTAQESDPGMQEASELERVALLRLAGLEGKDGSPDAGDWVAGLCERQEPEGNEAGSWSLGSLRDPVGGRVYSTALAALALR